MSDLDPRVRAVCDLNVAEAREYGGRHEYDGIPQDLSPAGVTAGLAKLEAARKAGSAQPDPHDEAHLRAAEDYRRVMFADLELHRRNPLFHLGELDLACYDKDYAPAAERDAARAAHLAAWPRVIDAAISSLDELSAPVAESLLGGIQGLAAGIPADADPGAREAALTAHARLVAHVSQAASSGSPDAALGSAALTALLGTAEATDVDLGKLAAAGGRGTGPADRAAHRVVRRGRREPACAGRGPRAREGPPGQRGGAHRGAGLDGAGHRLHPRAGPDAGERRRVPGRRGARVAALGDGDDLHQRARRAGRAVLVLDHPAGSSPGRRRKPRNGSRCSARPRCRPSPCTRWRPGTSRTTRRCAGRPATCGGRCSLSAFVEGWAHYAEELSVEEGFVADDPRFAIGVWLEALVRVTRLACALGVHTAGWTVDEAAARFAADTHLTGEAALSEARRATFDPTYGRYTWGKLEIMRRREQARAAWGAGFTLKRFHSALLALGSPPLGLLGTAIERG